jgi:hypothetical protein
MRINSGRATAIPRSLLIRRFVLGGRRLWVIGTRQWRFNSTPRTIPQWCKGSTPGNSTIAFLSASNLMGRSCGLSRVVGSSPIPGIFRVSSTVEQPPQGVIPRRPLSICKFITARAVMIQPQHSNQEAVCQTTLMIMKTPISNSPASAARGSRPKRM